jgi:hypothetical protein
MSDRSLMLTRVFAPARAYRSLPALTREGKLEPPGNRTRPTAVVLPPRPVGYAHSMPRPMSCCDALPPSSTCLTSHSN